MINYKKNQIKFIKMKYYFQLKINNLFECDIILIAYLNKNIYLWKLLNEQLILSVIGHISIESKNYIFNS